jgi:EmrB/QacA subfamily drug resistance transporter
MNQTLTQAPAEQPGGVAYKWKVLATVIFGIFMVILDGTVVNVAFPTLRQEFGASLSDSQWIISVYVLALGISTPLAGFLADRFGIKRIYLGGLAVFGLGSLLCGLAPSLQVLTASRALQGFGGGVALPLGMALLLAAFPPNEQGMALGLFGIAALVAPAVGPILGGWLVDQNQWRLIFFINPPIAAIGVVLGSRLLRERLSDRRPSLDVLGLITEIIGFGAVLYGASIAADRGWTSHLVLASFLIGAAGLTIFALTELYAAREPLLDLRLFKKPTFAIASILGFVSTWALFGAEFLMPVYLQALRGRSALETGLILLPMAITGGIFVTVAGRLYDRLGPRPLLIVGFGILMLNTWQLSKLGPFTPIPWIMFLLALRGIALGLTVQTTMVTALSVVPLRDLPRGSSLTNSTRNVVQAIGVAVLATVLASTLSPEIRSVQQRMAETPPAAGTAVKIAGICEPAPVASLDFAAGPTAGTPPGGPIAGFQAQGPVGGLSNLTQRACTENVAGFERAYTLTFWAAFLALILGLMLPGWPLKWAGRRAADLPAVH